MSTQTRRWCAARSSCSTRGELEVFFEEVCELRLDYSGDPDVAALGGWPADLRTEAVLSVWGSFFEMFDEVRLSEIEFGRESPGQIVGSSQMVARGDRQIPIDARSTTPGSCATAGRLSWP